MRAEHPADYFADAYRDYQAQNPVHKLDHYLDTVVGVSGAESKDLLDVGCGLGSFLARAAERYPAWRLSGLDIDVTAVSRAEQLVPAARFEVSAADAQAFPGASFDVVTAWDSIEHVEDAVGARTTIRTMLRSGGYFFLVVPVYDGITGPLIRRLDKDPTHLHKKGRSSWLDWMARDFEVVDWHGIYRYLLPTGTYVHVPTRRLRNHTAAIMIAARAR